MATYNVENQWGGSSASWNFGGLWVLGVCSDQNIVAIDIRSDDDGKTLTGMMTYSGENPIGFKATFTGNSNYQVENQWGGEDAPWHPAGTWVIGYRTGSQNVIALNVTSDDDGKTLTGTMTYSGEGSIAFKGTMAAGSAYTVENQWGGEDAPWHPGGLFVFGCRAGSQNVIAIDVTSDDGGKTLTGTMTYSGEGSIKFKGTLTGNSNYQVENQWGGEDALWHPGGTWIIGYRTGLQNVTALKATSSDGGNTFSGTMTYSNESPIAFKGESVGNYTRRGISAVFTQIYDGNSERVNTSSTPYSKFDILYVAFAHIDLHTHRLDFEDLTDGGKEAEKKRLANILNLVQPLRAANQLKVIISLGWGSTFDDIPSMEQNLSTFAPSVKEFLIENNLDGFDIDYETPTFSSESKFQEVAKAIRTSLGDNYLFTITPSRTTNLDGVTLNAYFDYVNVQCYEAPGDASCSLTDFTQMKGLCKSKILAGADVERKEDIANAVKKYKENKVGGLFAWQLSSDFDKIADIMWNSTRDAGK